MTAGVAQMKSLKDVMSECMSNGGQRMTHEWVNGNGNEWITDWKEEQAAGMNERNRERSDSGML